MTAPSTEPADAAGLAPARAQHDQVDGLAVVRRRRPDVAPDAPTVVLVHGAMDRAASFGRTMRRLPDLDVVAYDRRGYAGSPHVSGRGTLEAHAADLATVVDWTGAGSVVVVGHSMGGTVALALAAHGDDRLRAVGAFESPAPWLDDSRASVGGGAVDVADREGVEAGAEFFYRLMVGEHTWSRLRDRDRAARRAEGPALLDELRDLRDPATSVPLGRVSLPVVVGAGGRSAAHLQRSSALLEAALPDAQRVDIAESGHGAHLSHPDEFARFVRATVARTAG